MRDRDLKEILYIRVPPYLRAALEREATRQDEPIAATMRRILRQGLNVTPPGLGEAQ